MSVHTARAMPTPGLCLFICWGMPGRCSPTVASLGCNVPGDGRSDPPRPQCSVRRMAPKERPTRTGRSLVGVRRHRGRCMRAAWEVDYRATGGATRRPTQMEKRFDAGCLRSARLVMATDTCCAVCALPEDDHALRRTPEIRAVGDDD